MRLRKCPAVDVHVVIVIDIIDVVNDVVKNTMVDEVVNNMSLVGLSCCERRMVLTKDPVFGETQHMRRLSLPCLWLDSTWWSVRDGL